MNVSRPATPCTQRHGDAPPPDASARAAPQSRPQAAGGAADALARRGNQPASDQAGRARPRSALLDLPAEIRQEILLTLFDSQDRNPAALRSVALTHPELHVDARLFLTWPAERAAASVDSAARAATAAEAIAKLHPSLRADPVNTVIRQWPRLPPEVQVEAAPSILASLDTVMGPRAQRPTPEDPFTEAALALKRLRKVDAVALGFDGIHTRIDQLPLPAVKTIIPWRETRLTAAIPKLPMAQRLQAFDRMLQTFETRFKPDGRERSLFLANLATTVKSLRPADQGAAIDRLFQNLRDVQNHNETRTVLTVLRLGQLKAPLRPVFDQMIELARALPRTERAHLLRPANDWPETWVAAFAGPDQAYAREQVDDLNELHLRPD